MKSQKCFEFSSVSDVVAILTPDKWKIKHETSQHEIRLIAEHVQKNISALPESPKHIIKAINGYFFGVEKFSFSERHSLIFPCQVIEQRKGNCLGLSILYLLIAEILNLPMFGVLAPTHFFVRYDDGTYKCNIETTRCGSKNISSAHEVSCNAFFRKLTIHELAGCILVNRAVFMHAKNGFHEEALADLEAAVHFFPENPYAHFNKGIILSQLKGKKSAAGLSIEKALTLHPVIREELTRQVRQKCEKIHSQLHQE